MKLVCGVYAELETDDRPIFVCHHCGRPVCEEHGWVMAADDAFDASEEPVSRAAMHCPQCADAYHPRSASKRRGWGVGLTRPAANQAPAATPAPVYGPQLSQQPYQQPQPYPQQLPYPQQPPPPLQPGPDGA